MLSQKHFAPALKKVRSDQSGNKPDIRFQLHYTADHAQFIRFRLLNFVLSLNVSVLVAKHIIAQLASSL